MLGDVDPTVVEPGVEVVDVEADELADLEERHPAFGHEGPNESRCDGQVLGGLVDVEKWRLMAVASVLLVARVVVRCRVLGRVRW